MIAYKALHSGKEPSKYMTYEKPTVPVLLSADTNYFIPLVVTIESLLAHSSQTADYYFEVLAPQKYSDEELLILQNIENRYQNCTINVFEMQKYYEDILSPIEHISSAGFYRLRAASILKSFDKCIYLDTDVVVTGDILDLFMIDLQENEYIAAVKAPHFHLLKDCYEAHRIELHRVELGIPSMSEYINSGVLVMNLTSIRKNEIESQFIKLVSRNFSITDQDIINVACFGHIRLLPLKYNLIFAAGLTKEKLAYVFDEEMVEDAMLHPVIIHYASKLKPWNSVGLYRSYDWWKIVYKTECSQKAWERFEMELLNREKTIRKAGEFRIGMFVMFVPNYCRKLIREYKANGLGGVKLKLKRFADRKKAMYDEYKVR